MIVIDGEQLDDGVDEPTYDDNLTDEEIEESERGRESSTGGRE